MLSGALGNIASYNNITSTIVVAQYDNVYSYNLPDSVEADTTGIIGALDLGEGDTRVFNEGIRFRNIQLPKGAIVKNAYLYLTAAGNTAGTTVNATISGEDTDNSAIFTTDYAAFAARTKTTAQVAWNSIGAWSADTVYATPNIKTIVQEILDRDGWISGNSMTIFIYDNSSTPEARRMFHHYDGANPAFYPMLYIEIGTANTNSVINNQIASKTDNMTVDYHTSTMVTGDDTNALFIGAGEGSYCSGFRFPSTNIPQGATIQAAYITFKARDTFAQDVDSCNYRVYGQDSDTAAAFSTYAEFTTPGNRPLTDAYSYVNGVQHWIVGMWYNSYSIKAIVQEIVNRGGWAEGNAMAFFFFDNPDDYSDADAWRCIKGYDLASNPNTAPILHVEYTT
jgi:hypothetical protein